MGLQEFGRTLRTRTHRYPVCLVPAYRLPASILYRRHPVCRLGRHPSVSKHHRLQRARRNRTHRTAQQPRTLPDVGHTRRRLPQRTTKNPARLGRNLPDYADRRFRFGQFAHHLDLHSRHRPHPSLLVFPFGQIQQADDAQHSRSRIPYRAVPIFHEHHSGNLHRHPPSNASPTAVSQTCRAKSNGAKPSPPSSPPRYSGTAGTVLPNKPSSSMPNSTTYTTTSSATCSPIPTTSSSNSLQRWGSAARFWLPQPC